MKIGEREFDTGSGCYVMGILNVTPDSFSDGGRHASLGAAVGHALRMLGEGADIIDIGGESTRPGYAPVDAAEEMRRVVPVVEALRAVSDAPISVDTTKAAVAEAALAAGADMVNDVSALRADPRMAAVIAAHGAACCLMHSESAPEGGGFMPAVKESLLRSVDAALAAGVRPDGIVLDPGVGFAKNDAQNLAAVDRLGELRALGYPVLLGVSRKSVIGRTLGLPVDGRLEGTIALNVAGALRGASFFRVHDVKENVRALRMARAVMMEGRQDG